MLKNKKSSAPATWVWIAATFVILFIMFIYFGLIGFTLLNKGGKVESQAEFKYNLNLKTYLARELINFLETPTSMDGNYLGLIKNAEIVDGQESERLKLFKDGAKSWIDSSFPQNKYSVYFRLGSPENTAAIGGYYVISHKDSSQLSIGLENFKPLNSINIPLSDNREIVLSVEPR